MPTTVAQFQHPVVACASTLTGFNPVAPVFSKVRSAAAAGIVVIAVSRTIYAIVAVAFMATAAPVCNQICRNMCSRISRFIVVPSKFAARVARHVILSSLCGM